MKKLKVLITGSAGAFAVEFLKYAKDRYDFVCLDRIPTPGVPEALIADLTDLPALEKAFAGCDAVAHLGAEARAHSEFMSQVLPSNILGTYNVLEAAKRTGVKKVVFSSTVQVEDWWKDGQVTTERPPKPWNFYGASKVLGEHLGYIYSRQGLSFIALRVGWIATERDIDKLKAGRRGYEVCVTIRDLSEILIRSLELENLPYAVLPAYSWNAREIRDLKPLQDILGYRPQDDAFDLYGPAPEAKVKA